MSTATSTATYLDRINRARARMQEADIDVLLLSVGRDLPYLSGYEAMPLERLTMLVVPKDDDATLVVPRMEAPRVVHRPEVFKLLPWNETDDPIALVTSLVGRPAKAAVGDTMWARFLVDLLTHWPSTTTQYVRSIEVMNALRMRKDADEIAALAAAGAAVDRIAADLQAGRIPLAGRTEAEVSADLGGSHHRRGAPAGQLRNRRRRRERGLPASPRQWPVDPRRRDRAVRLRRDDGWILQRHHPLRVPGRAAG